MQVARLTVLAVGALGVAASSALAALLGPYTPDAATLHLYHLDDAAAPASDSAGSLPMQGLLNSAALGGGALPGFGKSLDTSAAGASSTARPILLAAAALANGAGDNVAFSHADPTTGAFTMEALVKFGYDPSAAPARGSTNALQVISMEGDGTADRIFQLRIDPIGNASGTSDSTRNRLEFINVRQAASGQVQSLIFNLPATGEANAPDATSWFHLAVTYNGSENTANNLSIYWTRVDPMLTAATLLAQAQMTNDMSAAAGDFAIGNEARNTGGTSDSFIGLIDEVRISSVARGPGDFIFVPEPGSLGLLGLGVLGLAVRRRRSA